MKTKTKSNPSIFNSTVTNAVRVLSHVWTQVMALENLVDSKLPAALKGKVRLHATRVSDDDATNATEDVTTGYMWCYELKDGSDESKRGKKKRVARLYFQVWLIPSETRSDDSEIFVPFLGIDVTRGDMGLYKLNDLLSYCDCGTEKNEGQELPKKKFPTATLGVFKWEDDEDGFWGVAAYVPLESISSENISDVIELAVQLAAHCQENWRHD